MVQMCIRVRVRACVWCQVRGGAVVLWGKGEKGGKRGGGGAGNPTGVEHAEGAEALRQLLCGG